jgi:hypothetical protein
MSGHTPVGIGRRRFLSQSIAATLAAGAADFGAIASALHLADDKPKVHNMLLVGEQSAFLSHLPMFDGTNEAGSEFTSPHRFQVILQASFRRGTEVLDQLYLKDRQAHPKTSLYTVGPTERFVLTRLFPSDGRAAALDTFRATVFRGHLEHDAPAIPGLEDVQVKVARVAHARMFVPAKPRPTQLEYILFGIPRELFVAHAIFGPPDFDHVLGISLESVQPSEAHLGGDVRVVFPDRKNVAADRIRSTQRLAGRLRRAGAAEMDVRVSAGREFYFEEGELLVPATFDPTPEEKKPL